MKMKGFSLLSFLLYLTLFSTITLFMCHSITFLVIPSLICLRKTQSLIALHIASDFFVRDIKTIAEDPNAWKVITPHELIWRTKRASDSNDDNDIGWRFSDNRLERREGIYDGAWKMVKTSIIAKGLANVVFIPQYNDHRTVVGIQLCMVSQYAPEKSVECYVCCANGAQNEKQ